MKYLFIFLLVSTSVFSQNYHYAVDQKPMESTDTTAPEEPMDFVVTNLKDISVDLSWTPSSDNVAVKNYRIYNNGVLFTSVGNVTSLNLPGLTSNTEYHFTIRAVNTANNESVDSNLLTFTTTSPSFPDNMPGEDDYLKAHLYPLAGASVAGLQKAIDTYGSVRLENGDYNSKGGVIYLGSNDKLYGYTSGTSVPPITILQGSIGVLIDGVKANRLNIQPGAPIKGCTFKNMFNTDVILTNSSFENNTLINIKGRFLWDCSTSGYFRNNTIIKQWIQGGNPQNIFRGNTAAPSYGNLQIWVNHLTPTGHGNEYHNVQDVTIIGLDSEQWNFSNQSTKAMTYMRNVGDVKITNFGGGNGNSTVKTPPFDIQADKLSLLHSNINNSGTLNSSIRANTNAFITNAKSRYTFAGTGYHINLSDGISKYNNSLLTGLVNTLSLVTNLKESIFGKEKKPIARPNSPTIPNPTGANWVNDRKGKANQAAYIQGLVDANKIAELPEGIYYIGSTIKLNHDEGIRGAGTGKTAIVGLTDNFPLITFEDANTNKKPYISNITLQGGHTGLKMQPSVPGGSLMVTSMAMHDVIFRDQTYGIHLSRFHGLDNNFFENVNFVKCRIGLFQDPNPNYTGGSTNTMMYMDKNVFYRSQVINCGVGYSMIAKRSNNLNTWVDCIFDGNAVAADLHANNYPIFANCDFKNHTGDYVVGRQATTSFYSCNFTNNATKTTLKMVGLNMEGCTISDSMNLLTQVNNNPTSVYILNTTIKGNLGFYTKGVISNSLIGNNPNLSKLLININSGILSTILNDTPKPYPQYLVKY